MVNTFLVHSDPDESASLLDDIRLNKQITEAIQILENIIDLRTVAQYYNYDSPEMLSKHDTSEQLSTKFRSNIGWCKSVISKYKKEDTKLLFVNTNNIIINAYNHNCIQDCSELEVRAISNSDTSNYTTIFKSVAFTHTDNDMIVSKKQEYESRYTCLRLYDEKIVSLKGYASHCITAMWIGYENALRLYINSHIEAWLKGTNKNGKIRQLSLARSFYNIIGYDLDIKGKKYVLYPWWYRFQPLLRSHQASLLRKEKARDEADHYIYLFTDVPDIYMENGYIWTAGSKEVPLSKTDVLYLITSTEFTDDDVERFACKISSD